MQLYLPVRSTDCAEAPVAANAATRPTVKDSILMKITPLLHVVEFTLNRGRRPLVCSRIRKPRSQKIVMAGLVPAIHVFLQMITKNVDARDPSPPRLRRGHKLARLAGALAKAASLGMT